MANNIPTQARKKVKARDGGRCVRCAMPGTEVHHRRSKSVHDEHTNAPCNLVTLCGWGNHTGCHGWVHSHPFEARPIGLIVSRHDNPEAVPITTPRYATQVLLTHEGTLIERTEQPMTTTTADPIKPCRLPRITIDPADVPGGRTVLRVTCHVVDCDWTYDAAVKVDAEQQKGYHREQHKRLVPKVDTKQPEKGKPWLVTCGCGWAKCGSETTTRADADNQLSHHLRHDHRLVGNNL